MPFLCVVHTKNFFDARKETLCPRRISPLIPSYRLHKPSGQAIVSLNGKIFYLGKYKSQASREEYNRIIADYLANNRNLPPTRTNQAISIQELVVLYLEYAEGYYVKNGKQTKSFYQCKQALGPLIQHYAQHSVSEFGPLSLVFVRDKWVEAGISRETINEWVRTIKQAFRWGVAREIVTPDVLHALEAVEGLKAGRTTAPEYKQIMPVSDETVEKTLPHCPPVIRDMIQVQWLGGMRPQDVLNMRSCDINQTGDVWPYRPFTHKTEHRGKIRVIALGPRTQSILKPYLEANQSDPEAFLFSPKVSVALQNIEKKEPQDAGTTVTSGP